MTPIGVSMYICVSLYHTNYYIVEVVKPYRKSGAQNVLSSNKILFAILSITPLEISHSDQLERSFQTSRLK